MYLEVRYASTFEYANCAGLLSLDRPADPGNAGTPAHTQGTAVYQ